MRLMNTYRPGALQRTQPLRILSLGELVVIGVVAAVVVVGTAARIRPYPTPPFYLKLTPTAWYNVLISRCRQQGPRTCCHGLRRL